MRRVRRVELQIAVVRERAGVRGVVRRTPHLGAAGRVREPSRPACDGGDAGESDRRRAGGDGGSVRRREQLIAARGGPYRLGGLITRRDVDLLLREDRDAAEQRDLAYRR